MLLYKFCDCCCHGIFSFGFLLSLCALLQRFTCIHVAAVCIFCFALCTVSMCVRHYHKQVNGVPFAPFRVRPFCVLWCFVRERELSATITERSECGLWSVWLFFICLSFSIVSFVRSLARLQLFFHLTSLDFSPSSVHNSIAVSIKRWARENVKK